MTDKEKIIVTGFTGVFMAKSFSDYHEDVEKRIGHSVFSHMFGDKEFSEKVKELYRKDFIAICEE